MADHSTIEWTDATWNPVTGCSVVSPGCTNCYAMRLAGTRMKRHPSREGLTTRSKAGPVWNGQVRLNHPWLYQPLKWKRPRRIFVCAHGDLFHESVPDDWIDKVFAVMALDGLDHRGRDDAGSRRLAGGDRGAAMTDRPIRIQRKRTKGWTMPPNTVYVGRPTKWGNPFVPGKDNPFLPGRKVEDLRHAFTLYRSFAPDNKRLCEAARAELRGKNLACWCPPPRYVADGCCHADVLLELANAPEYPDPPADNLTRERQHYFRVKRERMMP